MTNPMPAVPQSVNIIYTCSICNICKHYLFEDIFNKRQLLTTKLLNENIIDTL